MADGLNGSWRNPFLFRKLNVPYGDRATYVKKPIYLFVLAAIVIAAFRVYRQFVAKLLSAEDIAGQMGK